MCMKCLRIATLIEDQGSGRITALRCSTRDNLCSAMTLDEHCQFYSQNQ